MKAERRREDYAPPQLHDDRLGVNARLAAFITAKIGSMWTVYLCSAFCAIWMLLAQTGPLSFDKYPFPFLLFLGNIIQLLLIFIILLGQQVLSAATDKRARATWTNAEAILHECEQIQHHLIAEDKRMQDSGVLCEVETGPTTEAAQRLAETPRVEDEYVGFNGRLAAFITRKAGSMAAFYIAALVQFGWISLAQIGVVTFDSYPFPFLLFLSSLVQLLFTFHHHGRPAGPGRRGRQTRASDLPRRRSDPASLPQHPRPPHRPRPRHRHDRRRGLRRRTIRHLNTSHRT
jgi:uncharacterized membrane protein